MYNHNIGAVPLLFLENYWFLVLSILLDISLSVYFFMRIPTQLQIILLLIDDIIINLDFIDSV